MKNTNRAQASVVCVCVCVSAPTPSRCLYIHTQTPPLALIETETTTPVIIFIIVFVFIFWIRRSNIWMIRILIQLALELVPIGVLKREPQSLHGAFMVPILLVAILASSPYWSTNGFVKALNSRDAARVADYIETAEASDEDAGRALIAQIKGGEGRAYIAQRGYQGVNGFRITVASTEQDIPEHRMELTRRGVLKWRVITIRSE